MAKLRAAAAVLFVLLAASCASLGAGLGGSGPVVIGLVADLSSDSARHGNDVLKGATLRVAALNRAGGITGRSVRLEALDSKGNPAEAAKALARLADEMRACAVVEASFSRASFVLGSAADTIRVPIVSLSSDDRVTMPEVLSSDTDSPVVLRRFAFLMRPTSAQNGAAMARFALAHFPITRYALLSDPFSTLEAQGFRRAIKAGGKLVVASEELPQPDGDFEEPVRKIMSANPEAVFVCASTETDALAVQAARRVGLGALLLGNESWAGMFTDQDAGAVRNGWFVAPAAVDEETTRDFAAAFQREFGDVPRPLALAGWDAVGLIASAVLGSRSLERERIAEALAATRGYKGLLGTVDIDPRTHRSSGPPVAIMRILQGRAAVEEPRFPVSP